MEGSFSNQCEACQTYFFFFYQSRNKALCLAFSEFSLTLLELSHIRKLAWHKVFNCYCNEYPFYFQGNPEEHTILEFAQLIKKLVGEYDK